MANRFWVQDGGNWSDNTNHWSASSGGAPNASLPTSADSVYFDAASFTIPVQTVTVDTTAYCLDMDWTGATNTPTLAGASDIDFRGGTFITDMLFTLSGWFRLPVGGGTLITNGLILPTLTGIYVNPVTGTTTLGDNLNIGAAPLYANRGTFDTNGKTVICGIFQSAGAVARTITLGASTINCTAWNMSAGTTTLTANTATINVSGTGAFAGGGITTYHDVNLNGTAHTVSGSNTFHKLSFNPAAAQTITFTDTTTQTVSLVERTGVGVITLTGSGAAGWAITKSDGGVITLDFLSISYSTATPLVSVWYAGKNSTDGGNNFGWIFGERASLNTLLASGFIRRN